MVTIIFATLNMLLHVAVYQIEAYHNAGSSCYCLHQVVTGLKHPVSVIFNSNKGGRDEQLLVVELRGVVNKYELSGAKINEFMNIQDVVLSSNKTEETRGLLSVVADPLKEGTVFAYYIRGNESKEFSYISSFTESNGTIGKKQETYLLRIEHPHDNPHGNGGPMFFGDDGYLYIVVGDRAMPNDTTGGAQSLNTLHGKVLRIDVHQTGFTDGDNQIEIKYSFPTTNPFHGGIQTRREIFALGIRNLWGCSQDSNRTGGTGRIFCAETGTNKFDEINIIESGRNYGWNIKEGVECVNQSNCPAIKNEGIPIHSFAHVKNHSLVGGYVYRGHDLAHMGIVGLYIFGDAMTGKTYYLKESPKGHWSRGDWDVCHVSKCPTNARHAKLKHIIAFGQDHQGELYLLMTDTFSPNSESGTIFKIVSPKRTGNEGTPIAAFCIAHLALMAAMVVLIG